MQATLDTRACGYGRPATYLLALIFAAGNIILPRMVHAVPGAGLAWLPIFFFTLVGAWKAGWRVGLLTALASPLVSALLWGMPSAGMLPTVMLKGSILALAAGYAGTRSPRASWSALAAVVIGSQALGIPAMWAATGSLAAAWGAAVTALPGMALQLIGGKALLR